MRPLLLLAAFLAACDSGEPETPESAAITDWKAARLRMVEQTIAARGVEDLRVLQAMRMVPRHEFVPEVHRAKSYGDRALPIGHRQTISQPFIVAIMAEVAEIDPHDKVLEIGTGSGYGAAVLAELAKEVYTIEILEPLSQRSAATLERLGYRNVHVRTGDGYHGWTEAAPFDAIVVTAAPPKVPEPLKEQLAVGGNLVVPVGDRTQYLQVITRTKDGFVEHPLFEVRFVPMTGDVEKD